MSEKCTRQRERSAKYVGKRQRKSTEAEERTEGENKGEEEKERWRESSGKCAKRLIDV